MQDKPHLERLVNINKVSIFAEIGVLRGFTTLHLLSRCPSITKYYAIDPWILTPEYSGGPLQLSDLSFDNWYMDIKEKTKPFESKLIMIRKFSQDALHDIPDKSLDMVFIDANHSYEEVKKDILGWRNKVRVGGILSGHDYHIDGVKRAVNEISKNEYELLGLDLWWMKNK